MHRALQLARLGAATAAPNPMVGAVLVCGDRMLAEGWHRAHGAAHAEAACLGAFGPGPVPPDAGLYVNLEPCTHQGLTPPCVDLLIGRGVRRLVVAHADPDPRMNGRGIALARAAGIAVHVGSREREARWLNRRFLTFHEEHRPYIVLKWARTSDGFLDDHGRPTRISSPATDTLVHRWRGEEQAILVGSRTVVNDDPHLTVRHVNGDQPLRVVLDRGGTVPARARVFDPSAPTVLLTAVERTDVTVPQERIGPGDDPLDRLIDVLRRREVTSLLVEGGAELISRFMERGLWDEARVITGTARVRAGTRAPELDRDPVRTETSGPDRIDHYVNGAGPDATWHW